MSKVMPLAEAVRTFVRPGMSLYFGGAWAFPNAAMFEIVRQFVGRDPGFTLILSTAGAASAGPFLAAGLARRLGARASRAARRFAATAIGGGAVAARPARRLALPRPEPRHPTCD